MAEPTTTSRSDRRLRQALLALFLATGPAGCSYKVRLLSEPNGAEVRLPTGETVRTPITAQFRNTPFKPQTIFVEAPGYRTLIVSMQRTEGRLLRYVGAGMFQKGGREITFLLEPLHAPSGGSGEVLR